MTIRGMCGAWCVLVGSLIVSLVLAGPGVAGPSAFAAAQTAAPRAYTTAQAERGKAAYEQSCASCHGAALRGGANEFAAPALAGPFFFEKWSGRLIGEILRYAADNMPPDKRLDRAAAYVDVTAFIMQAWKYPAGDTELSADSPVLTRPIERQP